GGGGPGPRLGKEEGGAGGGGAGGRGDENNPPRPGPSEGPLRDPGDEGRSHGRVNRIPAFAEHASARLGRERVTGCDGASHSRECSQDPTNGTNRFFVGRNARVRPPRPPLADHPPKPRASGR